MQFKFYHKIGIVKNGSILASFFKQGCFNRGDTQFETFVCLIKKSPSIVILVLIVGKYYMMIEYFC